MFEIGSEFWTEPKVKGKGLKSLLPLDAFAIYLLCGRTALDIVIKDILSERNARSVYLPSYCCHTMIEPFLRNGIEVEFYDVIISEDGIKPILKENDCELVLLIDYFGFIDSELNWFAKKERAKGKTIIYDATHSLLFSNIDFSAYDYIYGSFRKWTGINAAFALKHRAWEKVPVLRPNNEYTRLRNESFDLKANYIRNPEKYDKNKFLAAFQQAEEIIETDYQNYAPDERSHVLMNWLDIERMRAVRRNNAEVLITGLKNYKNVILPYKSIKRGECPLFVPIIIKNGRNPLRKHLIDHSIYLPIHWTISSLHRLSNDTRVIYDEEISCVCDQRYSQSDMEHIVEVIHQFV